MHSFSQLFHEYRRKEEEGERGLTGRKVGGVVVVKGGWEGGREGGRGGGDGWEREREKEQMIKTAADVKEMRQTEQRGSAVT